MQLGRRRRRRQHHHDHHDIRSLLAQARKNSPIKAHERIPLSNQLDGADGANRLEELCLPAVR